MKPQQRDLSSSHECDCPTPPHPNVQRSISNVMKPENTVRTEGKRRWCQKKKCERAKNTVKTSANGQRQKTSLEETVVPAPPLPPRAALSRSRKHCKKQYKMHIQQCVCAWTPRRREQQSMRPALLFPKIMWEVVMLPTSGLCDVPMCSCD